MRGQILAGTVRTSFSLALATVILCFLLVSSASALPDNRAYELVTPLETNASGPGTAVPAVNGETVEFQSEPFGDAATGSQTTYQSRRTPTGWETAAITPKNVVQTKFLAQTAALFFTPNETSTIFTTAQPLAAGDQDEGALDLYEKSQQGALSWISQGSQGGVMPAATTLDGATPDGNSVVFSTLDSLVPAATGIESEGQIYSETDYLYDRNLSTGQTNLVDANDNGELLDPGGAILGNGEYITFGPPPTITFLPSDVYGTTTHAISSDGKKIFFESPTPSGGEFRLGTALRSVHLYMRKDDSVTVPLDDPASEGEARYLGASEDGSKVFFISNEGLAGDPYTDTELYMYDTQTEALTAISTAPDGSPPIEGAVDGVTAISNDGSHVYYVAKSVLASNSNGMGHVAIEGEPNLYVYDTRTAKNSFITQLSEAEVEPSPGVIGPIVSYLDLERPAVPTPDGNVLVFMSNQNLTGEDANNTNEIYRYEASTGALICVSCAPGQTGSASLAIGNQGEGAIGGGSYDPPRFSAPMDASGNEIFFNTENTLLPEDQNGDAPPGVIEFGELKRQYPKDTDVYEWENGHLYLLSSGQAGFAGLQGVTPSGDDVLIDTNVNLTKQDTAGYVGIYDVRVDGGLPEAGSPPTPPATCDGSESCRHESPVNPVFSLPGSATLLGDAEAPPAPVSTSAKPAKKAPKTKKPTKKKKKKKAKSKVKRGRKAARKAAAHKRGRR